MCDIMTEYFFRECNERDDRDGEDPSRVSL